MGKAFGAIMTTIGLAVIAGIILAFFMVARIPAGYVGVVYSISGGVEEEVLSQGWKITSPTERVIEYPVRTQTKDYTEMSAATRDGKSVSMSTISINYHVNPETASEVYKKFGSVDIEDLEEGYMKSRINDALRQTVSNYTVIETFGEKAGEIKFETLELAKSDLEKVGIIIEDIMISAPTPDSETQKSIDKRVNANQELERKKTDIEIAKSEAERKKIEAEGEAEANRIVQESLSSEILEQQLIEKWSGVNPITIGSEGVIVDLNLEEDEK